MGFLCSEEFFEKIFLQYLIEKRALSFSVKSLRTANLTQEIRILPKKDETAQWIVSNGFDSVTFSVSLAEKETKFLGSGFIGHLNVCENAVMRLRIKSHRTSGRSGRDRRAAPVFRKGLHSSVKLPSLLHLCVNCFTLLYIIVMLVEYEFVE